MAPRADGGEAEYHAEQQQAAPDPGARIEKPPERQGAASRNEESRHRWSDAQIGGKDAARDARKGEGKRESSGTHPSAGGGDALDVLQLAAVNDAALDRVIE